VWINEIGPILVGLAGLLTAIKGLHNVGQDRPTSSPTELSECRDELEQAHDQTAAALRHIYRLERYMAAYGLYAPERPESMYP
jgi:hypothetical protein